MSDDFETRIERYITDGMNLAAEMESDISRAKALCAQRLRFQQGSSIRADLACDLHVVNERGGTNGTGQAAGSIRARARSLADLSWDELELLGSLDSTLQLLNNVHAGPGHPELARKMRQAFEALRRGLPANRMLRAARADDAHADGKQLHQAGAGLSIHEAARVLAGFLGVKPDRTRIRKLIKSEMLSSRPTAREIADYARSVLKKNGEVVEKGRGRFKCPRCHERATRLYTSADGKLCRHCMYARVPDDLPPG